MRKSMLISLIFFSLLGGLLRADISVTPAWWECGRINGSRILSTDVILANNGGEPAVAILIETCDCFYAQKKEVPLAPGAEARVTLYFDASAEEGAIEKLLIIENRDGTQEKILFTLHAFVDKSASLKTDSETASASPSKPKQSPAEISQEKVVTAYFYFSPGCKTCERLARTFFPGVEEKLGVTLTIVNRDIFNALVMREYQAALQGLGVSMARFPALLVGKSVLQGEEEIRLGLVAAVIKAMHETPAAGESAAPMGRDAGISLPPEDQAVSPDLLFFPVLAAGLIDGINPCAFSTLIFLIVSLAYVGKSRRSILLTGIFFTLSVFITYFTMGVIGTNIFSILRSLPYAPLILLIVRIILIALLLLFAGLSIYDFILIRQGRAAEMVLQLPKSIKQRIHKSIRTYVSSIALISGALILGFYVSVFELACTGQIYFPVIASLVQVTTSLTTYLFLALYNVGFITPLAGVFVFIYLGASSQKVTTAFRKHMGLAKISLAAVFMALILIMILT